MYSASRAGSFRTNHANRAQSATVERLAGGCGDEDRKRNLTMCLATKKQIGYAWMLLRQAGYSVGRMDSAGFTELGASMRERNGSAENWLKGLSVTKASRLIQRLKWECRLNRSVQRLKEPE
jgi:hypothetical protein